ncbi:MAG: hypothetical protein ACFFAN_08040 [Promethearchaeota archaeon]
MTNLLEKALLTGFGIFTLILFFTILIPFVEKIVDFKENEEDDDDEEVKEEKEEEEEEMEKTEDFLNLVFKKFSVSPALTIVIEYIFQT